MEDAVMGLTRHLKAWRVRLKKGEAPAFMKDIVQASDTAGADVLVAKAELVFGTDHLRAALYHAKRAIAEGTNSSSSLAMETLLYASGERQLGSAIKKMSADAGTEEVVVAQLTGKPIHAEGTWKELHDIEPEVGTDRFLRFGLTKGELETLKGGRPQELVLEKVAAVDILKK